MIDIFKNELSLRPFVLAMSKFSRLRERVKDLQSLWETGGHLADNLFQSGFALRFQEIKISSLLRRNIDNKVGMRVDTKRGESAARRGMLVNTEPGAQSTYSVELDGDTCRSKVEKPAAALREETESCARRGSTSIKNGNFLPGDKIHDSEVDRAGNALELRSNLIVLGSREEVAKEGIEWSIILAFVRSNLVSELELNSDEFWPRHILIY